MNDDQRRVGVFMAAGLLLAVAVGFAVWNASAPRAVNAGYPEAHTSAVQHTAETAARTSQSRTSQTRTRPGRTADAGQSSRPLTSGEPVESVLAAPGSRAYRVEDDPLAPPHAKTQQLTTARPTTHYRPTNVRPVASPGSPADSAANSPLPPAEPAPQRTSRPYGEPEEPTTERPAPEERPETPTRGNQPGTTVPPTSPAEPTQPSEPSPTPGSPTEPTDPTAPTGPTEPTGATRPSEPTGSTEPGDTTGTTGPARTASPTTVRTESAELNTNSGPKH